ncbi:plant UBX domain-containing protein 4-like [Nymphaea colorata]|nr:plant UBX domain-containing protein 4-like [Nymphaea colorata]
MEGGEALVDNFRAITSCTEEEALFFLKSHNWQLDSAISSYYEDQQHHSPPLSPSPSQQPTSAAAAAAPSYSSASSPPRLRATHMASRDSQKKNTAKGKSSTSSSGRIRTLSDLGRASGSASSDENDGDAPQEYYAGGEKSGMLVQGPTKGNSDVDAIFDQARQLGALEGPVDQLQTSSSSKSFTGTARILSGETVQAPQTSQEPESVVHNIVFWSNGFTVNDGPLRRLDDPENAPFLESIRKSECPKELEPANRRTAVHVNLIRKDEDCPVQEKPHVPFQGVGRTLGSASGSSGAPEPRVPSSAQCSISGISSPGLSVDPSLPSTAIQLRLSDGTRMVARFNYHHTVGDVRAFLDAARPGSARSYQLQVMGFPPKLLTDSAQTIEQAGLANSVLVQKP